MNDEQWKDEEEESSVTLSPELARRYEDAGSIFLCRVGSSPVCEARVNRVSPNGNFARIELHGPPGDAEMWMPLDKCRIVDVLVPFVEKEEAAKVKETVDKAKSDIAQALQAIMGGQVVPVPMPVKAKAKPRKRKKDGPNENAGE